MVVVAMGSCHRDVRVVAGIWEEAVKSLIVEKHEETGRISNGAICWSVEKLEKWIKARAGLLRRFVVVSGSSPHNIKL
jgi:hypothetical protein